MGISDKTILYVDDEFINLKLFEAHFGRHYHVITATSAQEGLKVVSGNNIDLLITDFKMPGMNGIEFIKEIKKHHQNLKCIIISGYIENQVASEKEQMLIDDFLIKPWNKEAVIKAINKALD